MPDSNMYREDVEKYFRCGFREARYFFDPTIAHSETTPEEEEYVARFMEDFDRTRAAIETGDPFVGIEPHEYEDQRELSRLFNHRADDTPQFNRGQMREAIYHGRRLGAAAQGSSV